MADECIFCKIVRKEVPSQPIYEDHDLVAFPDIRPVAPVHVLIVPKEQRDVAAKAANPVRMSDASVALGREHYTTFCAPCHGPEGKGGVTGPVATKFIPPPDLTNTELQKQRTDGYWHSYIVAGGAVMPAYGEALSGQEAWHIVNFLRTLARK